jgi:protoheme IX farnesyltransferase
MMIQPIGQQVRRRFSVYWKLIKSLQTGLLLLTGLAGYMSARCPVITWRTLLALTGSLFLAISGSTVLNMVYDRDIDAKMKRTCNRPLPLGEVSVTEALVLGASFSALGVGWAFTLSPLYGTVVFAGFFFDIVVYTLWLKRRTAWSIVWGGIAGGMPILAGRTLGVGQIDWIGLLLSMAVLLWIPTHIMTFNLRHKADYQRAGVPTFPSVYGDRMTNIAIALSTVIASLAMGIAAYGIGMTWGYLRVLAVLSAGLLILAVSSVVRPSVRLNFGLFKFASIYMLSSMLLVLIETM